MSTSLLKSKQHKSKKNLKNLTISSPIQDYNTPVFNSNYSKSLGNLGVFEDDDAPTVSPTIGSRSPLTGSSRSPMKSGFMSPIKAKKSPKKEKKKSPLLISGPFSASSPSFYSPNPSPKTMTSETFDNLDNYDQIENNGKLAVETIQKDKDIGTVILVAKYAFNAENPEELSLRPKDYLKLLNRPGDGWLNVRKISNNKAGLIPATYVKIQVNDLINPVTHEWLNDVGGDETDADTTIDSQDLFDFEKRQKSKSPSPRTSVLPKTKTSTHVSGIRNVNVSQVLTDQERFWYRLDLKIDNDEVYLLKGYHDFYNLNYKLSLLKFDNLPNFPQPIKSSNVKDKRHWENVLIRCNDLNVYLNRVIKLEYYRNSEELIGFFNTQDKLVNPKDNSNETINDSLMPGTINLIDMIHPTHNTNKKNFVPTAPLPIVESESTGSITSLIDSYDQTQKNNFDQLNSKGHQSTQSTSSEDSSNYTYSSGSKREDSDSVFSRSLPVTPEANNTEFMDDLLTPITPITPPTTSIGQFDPQNALKTPSGIPNASSFVTHEFVRIKVHLNNQENDIVVVKVRNCNIGSMVDIKRLVSYKIYKDIALVNHYRLVLPQEHMTDEELVKHIKKSAKVSLTLVRSRGSI